jgi:hypothetical protein
MNEKAIQDAYEMFKSGGYNGSIDDYKQLISTNGNALKDSYEIFKGGGYNQDINSFKTLMGLKKKSDWGSIWGGGSSVSPKTDGDYTYGDNESAYRKQGENWLINNESTGGQYVDLKDPTGSRTKELNRNARRMSSLDVKSQGASIQVKDAKDLTSIASKDSEIFTGYPGKEKNQYEFRNGNWYEPNPEVEKIIQRETEKRKSLVGTAYEKTIAINIKNAIKDIPKTRVIKDEARIKALNKQFGKNAVAPIPSEVPSQKAQKTDEQDYFTGAFGDVLRGFDNIVPIGIGDFVDDMARSVASGYRQGTVAQEADDLLLKGSKSTPEQIQKFINANKNSQQMLPSAEMQDYQKIYEEEGKGFWGVVKGIVKNPSVISELVISSLVSMATNTDALKAGAAGVATGVTYGAATGATAGGVGAIPGSVAGAVSSIPYAFGLASSVVEMGATFGELLTEELKGKELTKENVKAILENPEKLQSIRNKAIARGVIIGTADVLTGKLASGVGAKIISKSAAKSATGAVTKGAVVKSTAAGAAIEAAGGSAGEATARGAIGQDMDVSEIALEGIAELPGGIRSTIQARLAKPSYKVNGAKATSEQVDELINTMTPDDLAKTKIEIKNDYEGREFKMQDKIVTNSIKQQVKQGNPELNEPSLNAITQLEKDLVKLEGNTTQTGKDKAAAIRTQIKNIQENQLQEEATAEASIPVQPTTAVGEEVVQREPTAEPQVLTKEGKAEEVAPLTIQEELQLIEEEKAKAPKADIERRRNEEILNRKGNTISESEVERKFIEKRNSDSIQTKLTEGLNYTNGSVNPQKRFIDKEDAIFEELIALGVKPDNRGVIDSTAINKAFSENESKIRKEVNKEVKQEGLKRVTDEFRKQDDAVKFKEINDKYDAELAALEAPVVEATPQEVVRTPRQKVEAKRGKGKTTRVPKVETPVVEAEAPKTKGELPKMRWDDIEEYDDAVIRAMKEIQYRKLNPLRDLGKRTTVAQKEEIKTIEAKIKTAEKILDKRANKIKREAQRVEKAEPIDKGTRVRGSDNNGNATEFSIIINEKKGTANVQLKKRKNVPLTRRASVEANLTIETDENKKRFVETKNKTKVYIDDVITPAKVEPTKAKPSVVEVSGYSPNDNIFNKPELKNNKTHGWRTMSISEFNSLSKGKKTYEGGAPKSGNWIAGTPQSAAKFGKKDTVMIEFGGIDMAGGENMQDNSTADKSNVTKVWKFNDVTNQFEDAPNLLQNLKDGKIIKVDNKNQSLEDKQSELQRKTDNIHDYEIPDLIKKLKKVPTAPGGEMMIFEILELQSKDRKINTIQEAVDKYFENLKKYFEVPVTKQELINDYLTREQKKIINQINELEEKANDLEDKVGEIDEVKAAPVKEEVKEEAKVETVAEEVKAEPVKEEAPAPAKESTDDLMGAINSIKKDIEDTTKEIEDVRAEAREKIIKIRKEIIKLENSKGKGGTIMDLEADIKEIEDILKEDLDGLKLDLDRHVQALKEEVKKLEDLDAKAPENKKTLLSYLDAAIKTLNGLNSNNLLNVKVDAGFTITKWVTVGVLKKILQGIRAGVIAGNTINASIRAMAKEYRGKHKNKKITIAEFTEEIQEYLRNTFVDQKKKTNEQDIQEARDKFVEIREAVRKAKVAVKTESKALRANAFDAIREMLKGKVNNLSAVQMKSIMLRLARFNVFSQIQYDKFIDYVDKVIGIADYDAKVNEANKNRKNAKENTIGNKPKLGDITPDLFRSLSIMLNIDAKLIPSDVFESYYKIVDMLSKRDTVLQLEQRSFLNENVDKIIASIELNDEKISDLKELYDNFEKVKEDGKVDYSGTLAKMLKDDVINQDEYELMKTFKSKIVEAKIKDKMTEQEIADEKAELIDEVNNTTITLDEIVGDEFRLERKLAKRLQVLLKQTDLKNLNNKDLKKLLIIIDNINNGFVSNATQLMVEKLNSNKKSIPLATSVHAKITSLYNKMNRFISKTFSRDEFGIAVAPLNLIDEQFGDFQTKNIYNSVFKDSAKAQQAFEAEISKIRAELTEIEKSLDKFFDKDHNKKVASKIKMMIYMLQIEKNSNPNSNKVHNAIDILDATIKFSKENSKKSKNSKADLKVLESIRENFVKDEQIDMDELFNSFGAQEKNALKKLQEINNSMTKKAAYTATVINGNKITTFDNYIFHNTISASDDMSVDALVNNISDNMQPTTKSKNLEERGDKALAMNLNPFLAVTVSSRSVLLNYHLTEPIRTARKTLIDTIKLLDAEKANGEKNKMTSEERKDFEAATKEQYDILNAIKDAYETATKDLLTSNFTESKQLIDWLSRQGYRAVLASAPRAVAELTSNALFVLSAFPKEITIGFNDTFSLSNSSDAKNILESLGSSLISRLYSEDSLSSVWLDTSAFANRISRDGKMKPKMVNGVLKFHDKYTGRWVDAVSFMADNLIAKPDQAIMRPLWFGSFVNSFKNKTGVEPDFNKIKENDEAYMDEYRDALEEARDVADNNADLTGGNMNPYMSSLQNVIRKEDSFPKVWLKTFQKYMNKFTVKEYYTARKGVRALVGDGDITQKQGALILTGVAVRMTIYTTVTRLLSDLIMYSFGFGDDDGEDDDDYNAKHIGRKLYQGFTSMLTTLILGRRFGNVVRMAENYFIEWANETYGEDIGLRNGEYDPYEDAVQFNQLQDGKIDKTTDLVKVVAGPYAPVIGTLDLLKKKGMELRAPEAKTERARITRAKEWSRLGLETTGFLGIMPLYKDVRKVFMGYTYKELKEETKKEAENKEVRDKKTALKDSQKTISLKEMMNSGRYTKEGIKKELRKIKDPEYRKALKDKDDAIRKKILDKYGYENLTDFKRNDVDNYEIQFGEYSPYRIKREESARIAYELKKRLNALKDGEEYYSTEGTAIVAPKKKANKYNRFESRTKVNRYNRFESVKKVNKYNRFE